MTPEKSPNETNLISWVRKVKEDKVPDYRQYEILSRTLALILEMLDKHNIAEVVLIKVEIRKALEILEGDAK